MIIIFLKSSDLSVLSSLAVFSTKFGSNISVSKANRVFTELKLPVIVCSNISADSLDVGNAIITLGISLSKHPLNVLAELHLLGLKPYNSCMY